MCAEEDRKERRRRLGLPEEMTAEEKLDEEERIKKQHEEDKKKLFRRVCSASLLWALPKLVDDTESKVSCHKKGVRLNIGLLHFGYWIGMQF